MTVLLIANVGNRDVWVDKSAPIPGDVHPQWNRDASRRALGPALQTQWEACRPFMRLPIIGKAADYVQQQAGRLDRVVLVASDQSGRAGVEERYLQQDTCTLSAVVERLLEECHGLASGAVEHWTVRGNPADYGVMQAFYHERLTWLRSEYPEATFYLEVSGGTPAMTSMLLAVGAEILALDARPLYVTESGEQPYPLDLGRRLVAESLIRTVRANLGIYAYHAAAQTVQENVALLREFVDVEPLLSILAYAYKRQSFSFQEACHALDALADSVWYQAILATAEGMRDPERAWVLKEGIYAAQIADQLGQHFEFVTRVFQFAEGMLRLLAIELGVEFVKSDTDQSSEPDGKSISQAWQERHALLVADMREVGIKIEYGANRQVMRALIERLDMPGPHNRYAKTLEGLERLEPISELRNRVVHRYHSITPELLRDTFYPKKRDKKRHAPQDVGMEIISTMEEVWCCVTGQLFSDQSPYAVINRIMIELLAADAQRRKE